MRLGIIDTHGLLRPEVFDQFADVDRIIHAGDIGPPDLLEELAAIAPVTAVWGNTDGWEARDRSCPGGGDSSSKDFDFVVTHGDELGSPSPTPEGLHRAFRDARRSLFTSHTHRPLLDAGGRGGDGHESWRSGAAAVFPTALGGDHGARSRDSSPRETGPPHRGGRGLAARRTLQLAKVVDIPGPEREATPSGRCAER